jgi:DNA-binding NtrC family response regulator
LVDLVHLVSFFQPNKRNKPNKLNNGHYGDGIETSSARSPYRWRRATRRMESTRIMQALQQTWGNRAKAAKLHKISRANLCKQASHLWNE